MKVRLCFLIRQLNDGGAQRQLVELVRHIDQSRFQVTVLTFYPGGRFCDEIQPIPGIEVISLDKQGRWDVPAFLWRLAVTLREHRPQLLHAYLGTSNILSSLLKPLLPGVRVIWGVRGSDVDFSRYDQLSAAAFRVECLLSRFADLIISNSSAGVEFHVARGFPRAKMVVIPNGIDTRRFRPDPHARHALRLEWGVEKDERLIGLTGRFDPMKDHPTFLRAMAKLAEGNPSLRFVVAGGGAEAYQAEMKALARDLGIAPRTLWLGSRGDMPAVFNALDILCMTSSYGEGFPNVVGEAMACGIPCVVTRCGDAPDVVGEVRAAAGAGAGAEAGAGGDAAVGAGDGMAVGAGGGVAVGAGGGMAADAGGGAAVGLVVPIGDPGAVAEACQRMLELSEDDRQALGQRARARIEAEFSPRRLVERTCQELERLL